MNQAGDEEGLNQIKSLLWFAQVTPMLHRWKACSQGGVLEGGGTFKKWGLVRGLPVTGVCPIRTKFLFSSWLLFQSGGEELTPPGIPTITAAAGLKAIGVG